MYREVAFIAFYFHWSRDAILKLEHRERQIWIGEIANLVQGELGQ
ncbi:MAG: DUF6760 family protein [Cyanobacteria bacterium J06592_8]